MPHAPIPATDDIPETALFNTIPITDIQILPKRQRQIFDEIALVELRDSIEEDGLIHCPSLREDPETGKLVLVAGERRLRVIKDIFALGGSFIFNETIFRAEAGLVPYTSLGICSEFEAERAELAENFRRKDLSWQEHAEAVARLHAFEGKRKEIEAQAQGLPTPSHSVADTATILHGRSDGSYQDKTRKEIILAGHLSNPVVAKAKTADEAFKLLKADAVRAKNIEAAIAIGSSFSIASHTIENVECLSWMRDFAASDLPRFDVICTDPPYGINAHSFGDNARGVQWTGLGHQYDDSPEAWEALMTAWAPLSFAVTAPSAHAYIFCDIERFLQLKSFMESAGWYVFRTPLIYNRLGAGRVPLPDRGPRRCYEILLYAIKGEKPVTHIYPDVISLQGDDPLGHGAQKPVALMQNLLQRSVVPGSRVLDCFAGTGPTLEAAHNLKCYATLLELDKGSYGIISERAKRIEAQSSGNLF